MKADPRNFLAINSIMKRFYVSPLGILRMAFDENALFGLSFADEFSPTPPSDKLFSAEHSMNEQFPGTCSSLHKSSLPEKVQGQFEPPIVQETKRWLDLYFSGQQPNFIPTLRLKTTPFRHIIYDILLTIPYGQTKTYGNIATELAECLHRPTMSAQAVGNAVAHNPILLIIPCHRVIGAKDALIGYAGGLRRKAWLLDWEERMWGNVAIPR